MVQPNKVHRKDIPCVPKGGKTPEELKPLGTCMVKGHWTQEQLPQIVKNLCKKYPNITFMEIRPYEIHFTFEMSFDSLIPKTGKRKEFSVENPSKRRAKTLPDCSRDERPCQKVANP